MQHFLGKSSCAQFPIFRGKSSCERTERYFFNGLQIRLHKNWSHAVLHFSDSIWAFHPFADILRPQSHGSAARLLFGMSSPTLNSSKIRFSIGAVRITADYSWPKSDPKNLQYLVAPNPTIGLFSDGGQLQIIFHRIMHRLSCMSISGIFIHHQYCPRVYSSSK